MSKSSRTNLPILILLHFAMYPSNMHIWVTTYGIGTENTQTQNQQRFLLLTLINTTRKECHEHVTQIGNFNRWHKVVLICVKEFQETEKFILVQVILWKDFLSGAVVKNLPVKELDSSFNPWVRKTPWSRKWQLIPEFLHGKFHGQRSLVGYSPWSWT